jgi:hypothetical protein
MADDAATGSLTLWGEPSLEELYGVLNREVVEPIGLTAPKTNPRLLLGFEFDARAKLIVALCVDMPCAVLGNQTRARRAVGAVELPFRDGLLIQQRRGHRFDELRKVH